MRSLYLIQQVDLNMLTVILLSGYRVLVAYPPWARTDHKPFSVEPKTEKALVWIARLRLRSCPASPIWRLPVRSSQPPSPRCKGPSFQGGMKLIKETRSC